MIKRIVLFAIATIVFFVTIGIPIFHHECSEKKTAETNWFIFSASACQCDQTPSCCRKIEKPDCCTISDTIVALKVDQACSHFELKFTSIDLFGHYFDFFIEQQTAVLHDYPAFYNPKPPPDKEYGVQLLKRHQVFRL